MYPLGIYGRILGRNNMMINMALTDYFRPFATDELFCHSE